LENASNKESATMKTKRLLVWSAANALGLGVAFVAMLQAGMLLRYGLDTDKYWQSVPPSGTFSEYAAILFGFLVGGLVLGSAQALVLRSRLPRVGPWIAATTAGFGLMVVVLWPLLAVEVLGRIPGPVEPILATVGSCSVAGLLQYRMLRGRGIVATKWLALWVGGLLVSLVPTTVMFLSLERARIALSWPMEVFLSGFPVAGVAALISGGAFFAAISTDSAGPVPSNRGAL
jgi:hypothetical protein